MHMDRTDLTATFPTRRECPSIIEAGHSKRISLAYDFFDTPNHSHSIINNTKTIIQINTLPNVVLKVP